VWAVELADVTKAFGDFVAVEEMTPAISDRKFFPDRLQRMR
jgi:hypothetical protein